MADRPSGTVTFLFTDVEGSTRLLREHGDAYAALLAGQRRSIRDAVARCDGVEIDTVGDAVFAAFARASDALAAAAAAQAALAGGPVRVRMGLHTGEPLVTEEGYVGIDVHRAARIAAAGHGGQVLLSQATRDLVEAEVRDLGEHRLKDLAAPERIFQLGGGSFPPLKSLGATNLPAAASVFLGRARELAAVADLLDRSEVRLVTLTGPGGSGKTRLALRAAAAAAPGYPDGAWWVALAALRDPLVVRDAIGRAVGATRPVEEHIGARRMLLVLDNFEQIVAAAPDVAGLLAACPAIDVLVTSREPLHVAGEWELRVDPLAEDEAAALFALRARAAGGDIEVGAGVAAAEICRRLDCLPLAVELAAARAKALSPAELLARLRRNVPVLATGGRDAPERQRTLHATIAWSHDLLSDPERRLFARLAVFSGGCTLEAAEAVCDSALDPLASLVDKSLLRRSGGRYAMLETIREYAAERLEASGEADTLRDRHAAWFTELAERARPHVRGRDAAPWIEALETEHGNIRAAHDWALARPDGDLAWRLAAAIAGFWSVHGHWAEGRRRLDATLARRPPADAALAMEALWMLGTICTRLDDLDAAETATGRLEALAEQLDDTRGRAAVAQLRGIVASLRGDLRAAKAFYARSAVLAVRCGDRAVEGVSIANLGDALMTEGDVAGAAVRFDESLAIAREAGDAPGISLALGNLGMTALATGDRRRSRDLHAEALGLGELGTVPDKLAHGVLGIGLAVLPDDAALGVRLVAAADAILEAVGSAHQGYERTLRDDALAGAEARLGAAAFAAAVAAGRALGPDDALAAALAAAV